MGTEGGWGWFTVVCAFEGCVACVKCVVSGGEDGGNGSSLVVCGLLVTEAVMMTLPPADPFFLRWWSPCVTVLSTPFRLTSMVRQSGSRRVPSSFNVSSRKVVLGAMPGYCYALETKLKWFSPMEDPTSVGEDVVHSPVQLLRSFE